jgi:secreted trypsin-like serine protease
MKLVVILSTTLAALINGQFIAVPRIYGGDEAKEGHHRYIAGLKECEDCSSKCAGSLIAPNAILTAAHCAVLGFKYAVVGTHMLKGYGDGELVRITREILHPRFDQNSNSYSHDVAILLLGRNITNIRPVQISFDYVEANTETWVRGWGEQNDGDSSPVLSELKIKTWDNAVANQTMLTLNPLGKVDHTMIAAGGVNGEDACQGDSGGPLTIESNTSSTVKLVGVVSWGVNPCGMPNIPGIYSRLSASKIFIENRCTRNQTQPLDFAGNQSSNNDFSQCA